MFLLDWEVQKVRTTKTHTNFLDNALNIKSLMVENIPELKFAVPKILPEGLSVLPVDLKL